MNANNTLMKKTHTILFDPCNGDRQNQTSNKQRKQLLIGNYRQILQPADALVRERSERNPNKRHKQKARFRKSSRNVVIGHVIQYNYGAYHLKLEINYPTFKTLRLFY
jgi:hypothetical protein